MSQEKVLDDLADSIVNFDLEKAQHAARQAIDAGIPAYEAVTKGMSRGMKIVGERFEKGEYFLSDLLMAGETMKAGMAILEPHLKSSAAEALGTVVIGTVKGDIHDIGKNIVATLLLSAGFKVHDLGTDVDAMKFVEAAKKESANIIALSALLTVTMNYMKVVIDEVARVGLRDKVKIVIGGAPINEQFAAQIGADAYGEDAVCGVEVCKRILGKS